MTLDATVFVDCLLDGVSMLTLVSITLLKLPNVPDEDAEPLGAVTALLSD